MYLHMGTLKPGRLLAYMSLDELGIYFSKLYKLVDAVNTCTKPF